MSTKNRLYDGTFLDQFLTEWKTTSGLAPINPQTVIFNIQSVYDSLVYRSKDETTQAHQDRNWIEMKDFDTDVCMPPYLNIWLEYTRDIKAEMLHFSEADKRQALKILGINDGDEVYGQVGILFEHVPLNDETRQLVKMNDLDSELSGVKFYNVSIYLRYLPKSMNQIFPIRNTVICAFRPDGTPLLNFMENVPMFESGQDLNTKPFYGIGVLTFRYLHQKTDVQLVNFPRNQSRRIERQQGKLPSPFFMLNIDIPKTRTVRTGGRSGTKGTKKAFHTVRGHFMTQPIDHPLSQFAGKTFFVSPHTRGDKEKGIIKKGYTVRLKDDEQ